MSRRSASVVLSSQFLNPLNFGRPGRIDAARRTGTDVYCLTASNDEVVFCRLSSVTTLVFFPFAPTVMRGYVNDLPVAQIGLLLSIGPDHLHADVECMIQADERTLEAGQCLL